MDVDHRMSNNQNINKKKILSDPMALFLSKNPETGDGDREKLSALCEQLELLRSTKKEIEVQTKIISRKIGQAKKNNQSTGDLMQNMQLKTAERKQVDSDLKDVEKNIFDIFNVGVEKITSTAETGNADTARRYDASIQDIEVITISRLDSETDQWNDYVAQQSAANIHHLTQWRDILKKTYGIESIYFLARNNSQKVVGVLPLVRLKSTLFGDILVSMPYFQRGGAIADHPLIEQKLIKAANEEAGRLGVDHIEYRDDIPRGDLVSQSHKANMVLLLPETEDELWSGFTAKLRAQIKRPQRIEPEVLIGGKEYLSDFYRVYTHNMRDLGSPSHSQELIENILDSFPGNSWIIIIKLDNKPVSAGLLLGYKETMEIPLASTLREVNPHSMNMLLYWEVLKLAVREGYKNFDFGRSSKDAGTYRFKQQWGARPKQLYYHYWLECSKTMPSMNADNPKYAIVIGIWKKLPVKLTRWIGPKLVKNIP